MSGFTLGVFTLPESDSDKMFGLDITVHSCGTHIRRKGKVSRLQFTVLVNPNTIELLCRKRKPDTVTF